MTPLSSKDDLTKVYDAFGIGRDVRTPAVLLANIENARRRSECLSAIEREFFTRAVEDDEGDEHDECPLNWGAEPTEYVQQFRQALANLRPAAETKCAVHTTEYRMRDELPCPWCVIDELKRNRVCTCRPSDIHMECPVHGVRARSPVETSEAQPVAWIRGHKTYVDNSSGAGWEYDEEVVPGRDCPPGKGWSPLYAHPMQPLGDSVRNAVKTEGKAE